MIIDFNNSDLEAQISNYNVCIAGGGVAGITLAVSLGRAGKRVLLLEAGGVDYSNASQAMYRGVNVGRDYFDLDATRLRHLGGTSNHWGGWCRPLDPFDFSERAHIDMSGWPIVAEDLVPYLDEAREILELNPFPDDVILPASNGMLKEVFFRYSPPVRFGEKYYDQLDKSRLIDVLLNANLIEINLDTETGRVSEFKYRGYEDTGEINSVKADQYVLALGGIENARMLLSSNKQISVGLGNNTDFVGRCFMDHLHHDVGYYITAHASHSFGAATKFLSPTVCMQNMKGIANAGFRLNPLEDWNVKKQVKDVLCYNDVIADLARALRGKLNCLAPPVSAGAFRVASEQVPNPNSRIVLSNETDRFGIPMIELDWKLSLIDKKTIKSGAENIARYFAQQDIGRVKIFNWVYDENEGEIPGLADGQEVGGHHHMGTTRMGGTKRESVVDKNGRVHELENLFIAGSSVFCTSGHANPTFTIVQLALRLADHLQRNA